MDYTEGECGCCVILSPYQKSYGIVYCPKHKAAPLLYEALKATLEGADNPNTSILSGLDWKTIKQAIAKAEGK